MDIEPGAFDAAIREAEADGGRDILAVAGSYHSPLASVRRGTLSITRTEDGYRVALAALPDSTAGRDVVAAAENTPLLVRPVFDELDAFDGEEREGVLHVRQARLKAVLVGPTDRAAGWPEAEITEGRAADAPRQRSGGHGYKSSTSKPVADRRPWGACPGDRGPGAGAWRGQ